MATIENPKAPWPTGKVERSTSSVQVQILPAPPKRKKRRHWLNVERRQRIAVCSMAVVIGCFMTGFLGPILPAARLPAEWCLGLALAGYAIAAGLLVYLWKIC